MCGSPYGQGTTSDKTIVFFFSNERIQMLQSLKQKNKKTLWKYNLHFLLKYFSLYPS